MDLSKAFDSVHHDILLNKCNNLNIDSFWIESYLKNRVQSVRINSITSSPKEINFGVPQGSILGPHFFTIHINDMPEFLPNCLLVLYADDSQILLTGTIDDLEELITRAEDILLRAKSYFKENCLLLNEGKTQCIFFCTIQHISQIPANSQIRFGNIYIVP